MQKLVLDCHNGLGNRARSFLSARLLAKQLGVDFSVYWSTIRLPRYSDIFSAAVPVVEYGQAARYCIAARDAFWTEKLIHPDASILDFTIDIHDHQYVATWPYTILPDGFEDYDIIVANMVDQYIANYPRPDGDERNKDQHRICKTMYDVANTKALKIADEFCKTHNIEDRVGLHVRRTDLLWKGEPLKCRLVVDDDYHAAIDEHDGEKLFLATDDIDVKADWDDKYKDRLAMYDDALDSYTGAVVDLLILSRCKKILAGSSSFVDLAVFMNGAELVRLRSGLNDITDLLLSKGVHEFNWSNGKTVFWLKKVDDKFQWKVWDSEWTGQFDTAEDAREDWRNVSST